MVAVIAAAGWPGDRPWRKTATTSSAPATSCRITVFQNPDLTTETRVSESGTVTFPLIGAVPAAGQSASALEQAVVDKLRDGGFVKRPQVNVNVLQYKSIQVSVLGQVNRPGRFPLDQAKNRLSEVLALAGGILPTGADIVTLVTRENGQEKKVQIDVPGMLQTGDLTKDIPLQNGDVKHRRHRGHRSSTSTARCRGPASTGSSAT